MALVGAINFMLGMESRQFTAGANRGIKDLNRLQGQATGLTTAFGGMNRVLGAFGIGLGVSQATNFLRESIVASNEAAQMHSKLEAVLAATGGTAGLSAEQMGNYATKLQTLTGVDDDLIKSSQAVLATFRNVHGEAFTRGTALALDMSRVMGTDLQSSILQVGKALNDPLLGITALRRAGVQFSEDQKEQIKNFMAVNDIASAQGVILQELSGEFGGAAEKMRTDLDSLTTAWENLKEAAGKAMTGRFGSDVMQGMEAFINVAGKQLDEGRFIGTNMDDSMAEAKAEASRLAVDRASAAIGIPRHILEEAEQAGLLNEHSRKKLEEMRANDPKDDSGFGLHSSEKVIKQLESAAIEQNQLNHALGSKDLTGLGGGLGHAIAEQMKAEAIRPPEQLSGADIHAIDTAIAASRPAGFNQDEADAMRPPTEARFAGAATRGSEEAFASIAAFQGQSRQKEPPTKEQADRQIKALESIEKNIAEGFAVEELTIG